MRYAAAAMLAGEYLNTYAKSHDLQIADALIAATASIAGEELATLNTKHFPMLAAIRPY
jgi:predicted nucleic acid-binding protein